MTRMRFTAQPVRGQNCIRLMMTAGRYCEIDLSRDEAINLLAAVSQAVSDLCLAQQSSSRKKPLIKPDSPAENTTNT